MTDFNLFEWMIENKIARNGFNASAILNGLQAWKLNTTQEKQERVLLYRKWRTSKHAPTSKEAFELAIAGIDPDHVTERQIGIIGV